MKSLWIGPFTILSANYNRNNYSLDLSSDLSPNLTYNVFHVSKIKAYTNNNSIIFPEFQLEKPGAVTQERYEVKRVIEYRKAPTTEIPQCNVRWFGYLVEDDQWTNAKDITVRILQDLCTKGSWKTLSKDDVPTMDN